MTRQRVHKLLHLVGTAWFVLCVGYILILALRQAGQSWWVIASLSGYSTLVVLLLISLYLFAIYRGVARSQKIEVEHPLTTTAYYALFYATAPFLGAGGGTLGMIGEQRISQFLLGIALGTLGATFLVWIVVDPAIAVFEMLLPGSREHRMQRLAELKALRDERDRKHRALLAEVRERARIDQALWQEVFQPYADKLAAMLAKSQIACMGAEKEAVEMGLKAWQIGGLNCMRYLHSMAMDICRQKYKDVTRIDLASVWWDGIGTWRYAFPG